MKCFFTTYFCESLQNMIDQWYENWEDIPDFQFDNSMSGIKLNIPDSAKDNPLQIYSKCYGHVK